MNRFLMIFLCLFVLLNLTAISQENRNQKGKENNLLSNTDVVESVMAYSTIASDMRSSYTYDSDGNISEALVERWLGRWDKIERSIFTYDENGMELTSLVQLWKNDQWEDYSQKTCTYDADGNILSYKLELWENNEWVTSDRYTYT